MACSVVCWFVCLFVFIPCLHFLQTNMFIKFIFCCLHAEVNVIFSCFGDVWLGDRKGSWPVGTAASNPLGWQLMKWER